MSTSVWVCPSVYTVSEHISQTTRAIVINFFVHVAYMEVARPFSGGGDAVPREGKIFGLFFHWQCIVWAARGETAILKVTSGLIISTKGRIGEGGFFTERGKCDIELLIYGFELLRVSVRHFGKCHATRSNLRDMTIFRFFQNSCHLPSWICYARVWNFGLTTKGV